MRFQGRGIDGRYERLCLGLWLRLWDIVCEIGGLERFVHISALISYYFIFQCLYALK